MIKKLYCSEKIKSLYLVIKIDIRLKDLIKYLWILCFNLKIPFKFKMYFIGYLNCKVNICNCEEMRKCSMEEYEDQNRDRLVSEAIKVCMDDIH